MKARREFRDRPETEVAVLDALVERNEEGMTVLELRASTEVDIDHLEEALSNLKRANLIHAEDRGDRTVITVDDAVLPHGDTPEPEPSIFERLRDRLGL
jgi:DNA-binding transcriptional ArsR family regulator